MGRQNLVRLPVRPDELMGAVPCPQKRACWRLRGAGATADCLWWILVGPGRCLIDWTCSYADVLHLLDAVISAFLSYFLQRYLRCVLMCCLRVVAASLPVLPPGVAGDRPCLVPRIVAPVPRRVGIVLFLRRSI